MFFSRGLGITDFIFKIESFSRECFDPINVIICNKLSNFRDDLADISAKMKTLVGVPWLSCTVEISGHVTGHNSGQTWMYYLHQLEFAELLWRGLPQLPLKHIHFNYKT